MSRESRQRQGEVKQRSEKKNRWIPLLIVIALVVAGLFVWQKFIEQKPKVETKTQATVQPDIFKLPTNFAELCAVKTNDLMKCDIALMNLLCAEGLRGAENLNAAECLSTLDNMAKAVEFSTARYYYKFREHPDEFNHSEGYYKMMMLATVVQEDFKVHYNPDRIQIPGQALESDEKFFANSQDIFIHGLAREGGTGTCSSMPVFYVAIGRRLGYPLKLVKAKGHLFARWEQGTQRFNIEATSIGFVSHTDDEYRTWPAPFTAEEEQAESYLKPLTPVQELAVFLSMRGMCLRASGDFLKSLGAMAQAFYKEPQSIGYQKLFARAEHEAYMAGVLPKRVELQYAINSLELPDGPKHDYFAQHKALLDAKNARGEDETMIEIDLVALKSEILNYQNRLRLQKEPLQNGGQALQTPSR